MDVETYRTENGTWIEIKTDQKVAVAVDTGNAERIYLPGVEGDDSTYYAENTSGLIETEEGYTVLHPGNIEDLTVLG